MTRTVILHYHLFKNAGTSVDQVLKENFGDRWVQKEFPMHPPDNSDNVAQWIADEPDAVAFSTHTAMGPIPEVPDTHIVSIMMLRDPIDRIRSAYRFERQQEADTFGAQLAKETDLEGYVRTRLALPKDRQCRNFQTYRLASLCPGPEPEIERALRAMREITVLGSVDDFEGMLSRLAKSVASISAAFIKTNVQANLTEKLSRTSDDDCIDLMLIGENTDDLALLHAAKRFGFVT